MRKIREIERNSGSGSVNHCRGLCRIVTGVWPSYWPFIMIEVSRAETMAKHQEVGESEKPMREGRPWWASQGRSSG
jgi:hypothetical protein